MITIPKGLPFCLLQINDLQIKLINDLAAYINQEVTDTYRRAVRASKQFSYFGGNYVWIE